MTLQGETVPYGLTKSPEYAGSALPDRGQGRGKRGFVDELGDPTKPRHGECREGCWRHESPEKAARHLEGRVWHVHV